MPSLLESERVPLLPQLIELQLELNGFSYPSVKVQILDVAQHFVDNIQNT